MCLGIVMKIEEINGVDGICEYCGCRKKIRLDVIGSPVVGDYVLIHAGFAINKLTKEDGEERIKLLKELDKKIKEGE